MTDGLVGMNNLVTRTFSLIQISISLIGIFYPLINLGKEEEEEESSTTESDTQDEGSDDGHESGECSE